MKITKSVLALLLISFSLLSCENNSDSLNGELQVSSKKYLRLKTVHGDIIILLHEKEAPLSVSRIKDLTKKSFYDGLAFHKVIPNFIVQTGAPQGDIEAGSSQYLKAEKSALPHQAGSVSIARYLSDPNSADSQFFICLSQCHKLDEGYTVFGSVIKGFQNVKKIQQLDKIITMSLE